MNTNNGWGNPVTAAINANHNSRAATLDDWRNSQKALKLAQAEELRLRMAVIGLFSDKAGDATAVGTENVDAPGGKVKIVRKLNYNLGNADAVDEVLDKIEKSMVGGNIVAERLVKWSPELSLTEYKLLSAENKKLIDTVLTTKPALPSVEFIPTAG